MLPLRYLYWVQDLLAFIGATQILINMRRKCKITRICLSGRVYRQFNFF